MSTENIRHFLRLVDQASASMEKANKDIKALILELESSDEPLTEVEQRKLNQFFKALMKLNAITRKGRH